jgi:hypothetical protein
MNNFLLLREYQQGQIDAIRSYAAPRPRQRRPHRFKIARPWR